MDRIEGRRGTDENQYRPTTNRWRILDGYSVRGLTVTFSLLAAVCLVPVIGSNLDSDPVSKFFGAGAATATPEIKPVIRVTNSPPPEGSPTPLAIISRPVIREGSPTPLTIADVTATARALLRPSPSPSPWSEARASAATSIATMTGSALKP